MLFYFSMFTELNPATALPFGCEGTSSIPNIYSGSTGVLIGDDSTGAGSTGVLIGDGSTGAGSTGLLMDDW